MKTRSLPDQVSINWLAVCTGYHAATVKRRVTGLLRDTQAKLNRVQALEAVYIGTVATKESGHVTTPEAVRRLTIEKALQVQLQNECTRRERIPIQVINEINSQAHRSIAAIIKAQHGKLMTMEAINEIFDQLRSIPEQLAFHGNGVADVEL